uniref:Uncharacterized protein n=1 Tax=Acrobeloides nanus TaxID=290746 RepID=A0A914DDK2_9BILA
MAKEYAAQEWTCCWTSPELVQLDDSATLGLVFANTDMVKVKIVCLDEANQTTEAEAVSLAALSTSRLALLV